MSWIIGQKNLFFFFFQLWNFVVYVGRDSWDAHRNLSCLVLLRNWETKQSSGINIQFHAIEQYLILNAEQIIPGEHLDVQLYI